MSAGIPVSGIASLGVSGISRFPGNPSHDFAVAQDPGRPRLPRQYRQVGCCPRSQHSEGVVKIMISGLTPPLHHPLSTLHE